MDIFPFSLCLSKDGRSARDKILKSRQIDKELRKEKDSIRRRQRILLLGSAESGKSTFLKQMRIIHGQTFSKDEMLLFKLTIYQNICKGMLSIMHHAKKKVEEKEFEWDMIETKHFVEENLNLVHSLHSKLYAIIMPLRRLNMQLQHKSDLTGETPSDPELNENVVSLKERLFLPLVDKFKLLWKERLSKFLFHNRHFFDIDDSMQYFMENIDRIGSVDYIPTIQDIVHSRRKTVGILEYELLVNRIPFVFIDVGGQRTERQNWIKCFAGVMAILFLASSSEFDQKVAECPQKNKMRESLEIFQFIVNNKININVAIILFLNKIDVLEKKIKVGANIGKEFIEFNKDPKNIEDVLQFELNLFDSMRRDRKKPLFHHNTTAVDTENIRVVFDAVKDTIVQDNLNSLMLH